MEQTRVGESWQFAFPIASWIGVDMRDVVQIKLSYATRGKFLSVTIVFNYCFFTIQTVSIT